MATESTNNPANEPTSNEGVVQETLVSMTQEKLNEIIDKAVGRASAPKNAALAAAEAKAAQLETELAQAKAAVQAAPTHTGKTAGNKTVEELEAKLEETRAAGKANADELERQRKVNIDKDNEVKNARQETLNIKRDVAITKAASKLNFVDLGVISQLTQNSIVLDPDTGKFTVIGDNGQPRMNASYEPMTLDEFYNDFAAKNKYLVRSNAAGGTGQGESSNRISSNGKYEVKEIFGKESVAAKANALAKADPAEYHRLKAVAKEAGLI